MLAELAVVFAVVAVVFAVVADVFPPSINPLSLLLATVKEVAVVAVVVDVDDGATFKAKSVKAGIKETALLYARVREVAVGPKLEFELIGAVFTAGSMSPLKTEDGAPIIVRSPFIFALPSTCRS